jgi:5-methyltetrahydropteroyltriglutamate--homocysteine methyltransferase
MSPNRDLPLIPTSVVGSHGLPGWMYSALDQVEEGRFGATDEREMYDDAVKLAIQDQESSGIDLITDGEMRRWKFVQSFYDRMEGLSQQDPLRKLGPEGYDSVPRYVAEQKITVPEGLGIVSEFNYAQTQASHALKATCPGPVTMSIHIREKPSAYKNRLELANEFVAPINAELKALVAAGAKYIQIDEPSHSIIGGTIDEYVDLFNRTVEGVDARVGLHICFGNLASRPRFERGYADIFPKVMDVTADELVLEFANREMRDLEVCEQITESKDVVVGVVDVKSFHIESADEVAGKINKVLEYSPAERVGVVPDCGFFTVPRWLTVRKLQALSGGADIVRKQLAG